MYEIWKWRRWQERGLPWGLVTGGAGLAYWQEWNPSGIKEENLLAIAQSTITVGGLACSVTIALLGMLIARRTGGLARIINSGYARDLKEYIWGSIIMGIVLVVIGITTIGILGTTQGTGTMRDVKEITTSLMVGGYLGCIAAQWRLIKLLTTLLTEKIPAVPKKETTSVVQTKKAAGAEENEDEVW